jgi:hypothetical protein
MKISFSMLIALLSFLSLYWKYPSDEYGALFKIGLCAGVPLAVFFICLTSLGLFKKREQGK